MKAIGRTPSRAHTTIGVLSAGAAIVLALTLLNGPAAGDTARVGVPTPESGVTYAAALPAPGTHTGLGFDTCSAPSTAQMQAWLASPYRAVGIYFGGINRGCAQPNLNAAWVSAQQAAGWHLVPIYMGLQAPCTLSNKIYRIAPATAAAQGRSSADDAVVQAKALGLDKDSALILDMEAYRTGDATCRSAVLAYSGAWNARLHDWGYTSGFYGSMSSGVADEIASYQSTTRVRPDYLDFARWDGVATISDGAIPAGYWADHRRMKQYLGGHNETWGGVTMNIDNDYLDVAALPTNPFGDFNGNGWSDLLSRQPATGRLYLYPGNGTFLGTPLTIGTGWNSMSAITRFGDFNRNGYEDVIAREAATGYLWLYPRTSSGWGSRLRVGTGWNSMREITAIGDLNRDGYNDLLAVRTSTGYLYMYPGRGNGFGSAVSLGSSWNTMDELTGVGDFNRDGYTDLMARQKSTGYLFFYPGRGVGFASRVKIGVSWNNVRDITGIGDFDRDGYTDIVVIEKSSNVLYRYPGRGTGLATRVKFGTSWGGMIPLL